MNFLDEARTKKEDQQLFFGCQLKATAGCLPSDQRSPMDGSICGDGDVAESHHALRGLLHCMASISASQQFNLSKTHGCILSLSARYLWNVVVVASSVDSQICTNLSD